MGGRTIFKVMGHKCRQKN